MPSGSSSERGSAQTMSSSSSSVRPTRGPRSSAPKRQRVAPVGENAGQRDQVLDFLPAEQALAGLGRDRDAVALQRFLIAPQIAPGRREQARCRPGRQGRLSPARRSMIAPADQACAQIGDGLGFPVALLLGRPCRFRRPRRRRARPRTGRRLDRREKGQGREARLTIGRQHGLEALVDEGEDRAQERKLVEIGSTLSGS